jgi:large subunit ribosomal protein L6
MSRIGKMPIELPTGVQVKIQNRSLTVKGAKGELNLDIPGNIAVGQEGQRIIVKRPSDNKRDRSLHGVTRSLIANMVKGVTNGFEKRLQIIGVGYRCRVEGERLVLQLGFSHEIKYRIPEGIKVALGKGNTVTISGCDKQLVGEVAAEIRSYYRPEPYKGKGVRYEGEWVRHKAGKAVAST